MADVQAREVEWYRRHGRYPERVRVSGDGRYYVVGDWSWNRLRATKPEFVEPRMHAAGVYCPPCRHPARP